MHKTSVYTLVNGNISKNHKRWYCPHHTDCVSMCCWIIPPLWFLLFLMCEVFNIAVNKCINWCFVHLYLRFYY